MDSGRLRGRPGWLALFVLAATCLAPVAGGAQHATSGSGWDESWPMSDAFVGEHAALPDEWMPRYELDVTLDPLAGVIGGQLIVEYTNHTGQTLTEVPFRLYPNGAYYLEGELSVTGVLVDDRPASADLAVGDTVLFVLFSQPLTPEKSVTIEMHFETVVPVDSAGSFGILSHDLERQTWILSDWYPIIAGWDDDSGWDLEPPSIWGDPTFAETSIYAVTVTVPRGTSVVATGRETVEVRGQSEDRYRIETGPVRELTMVLDDGFAAQTLDAGNTEIGLFLDGSQRGDMTAFLDYARQALQDIEEILGPYAFDELDIVQTELAGALGVSWSGVLFIDAAAIAQELSVVGQPTGWLTFILTHEIAHQWWGGMTGVNSNDHAFMNESLANYTSVLVYERLFGDAAARALLEGTMAAPYLAFLTEQPDMVVDRPIADVESVVAFGRMVYGKGSLGMHAIRLAIGDDAFLAAISAYGLEYAFGVGSPGALLDAFETASGQELGDLWMYWFESADTTISDVENLLKSGA